MLATMAPRRNAEPDGTDLRLKGRMTRSKICTHERRNDTLQRIQKHKKTSKDSRHKTSSISKRCGKAPGACLSSKRHLNRVMHSRALEPSRKFCAECPKLGIRGSIPQSVNNAPKAYKRRRKLDVIESKGHANSEAIYRPLDVDRKEIRLLIVEPGSGEDTVKAFLRHASLLDDPKPVYETISYVWVDQNVRATIVLNDCETDIPSSAERVLRRMRHPDKPRTLWIDAACINQTDVRERGHQVGIMDEVYSNTSNNLIWLGDEDGYTERALKNVDTLISEIRKESNDYATLGRMLYGHTGVLYSENGFSVDMDEAALQALLRSPWFSRLWIVQEAYLSPKNSCYRGSYELSLQNILLVAAWLRYKHRFLRESLMPLQRTMYIFDLLDPQYGFYSVARPPTTLDILHSLRDFDAQDQRDHVYALLGLLKPLLSTKQISRLPIPDYTIPPAIVFQEAARFAIHETNNLHILPLVTPRRPGDDINGFPTWIPRWDRARLPSDPEYINGFVRADNAEVPGLLQVECPAGILTATGTVIDKVASTRQFPGGVHAPEIEEFLQDVENMTTSHQPEDVQRVQIRLGVTLTAGGYRNQATMTTDDLDFESSGAYSNFKLWLMMKRRLPPTIKSASTGYIFDSAWRFAMLLYQVCRNRAFFNTSSGYIGVGPENMQNGDTVAVLYGCRIPVVLRKSMEAPEDYELVGICYVHGVMEGEAVRMHRARGSEDTIFRLR